MPPRVVSWPRAAWSATGAAQIDPANVFFELTKEDKVARAPQLRCEVFIDDLPEILAMAGFPDGMRRILFDPENQFAGNAGDRSAVRPPRHPGRIDRGGFGP